MKDSDYTKIADLLISMNHCQLGCSMIKDDNIDKIVDVTRSKIIDLVISSKTNCVNTFVIIRFGNNATTPYIILSKTISTDFYTLHNSKKDLVEFIESESGCNWVKTLIKNHWNEYKNL